MKRLLAIIFTVALFVQFSSVFAFAQTPLSPAPSNTYTPLPERTNADVPQNTSTRVQVILLEVLAAFSCQITGIDPINPSTKCLGADPTTGKIGFVEQGGGAIGLVTHLTAMTFNTPIHTSSYVQYVASNFGITKSAYAEETSGGLGFKSLGPLLETWVVFRNITYVLFVIIFMLIGIAITFRFKIDPRTVMTIQNAIPKAVVTLVLVTFSFAIVGFFIDIMYLVMFLLYEIMAGIPGVRITSLNPVKLQGENTFGALGFLGGFDLIKNASVDLGHILQKTMEGTIVDKLLSLILAPLNPATGLNIVLEGVQHVTGLGPGAVFTGADMAGVIGGFIAFLIIGFALFYALLRLWFLLLKAYLFIMVDTVVAPLWIAGSLIPGSPLNFSSWFKHIFSYIAVFPVTFFMFLLGSVFVQQFSDGGGQYFTPPFIGNAIDPKYFGSLIGLAVILMTTEVVNMVKDTLKAPSLGYQKAIGEAGSMGTKAASAVPKMIGGKIFDKDSNGMPKGVGAIFVQERVKPRIEQAAGKIGFQRIIDKSKQMKQDYKQKVYREEYNLRHGEPTTPPTQTQPEPQPNPQMPTTEAEGDQSDS